jgi:hypothetical protein
MKAQVGDHLIIEGTTLSDPRRVGVIVEVSHPDGTPPYLVRWENDEHESLVIPGPTARIEPMAPVS